MQIPSKYLEQATEQLATLPGIGKRTALRLALSLHRRDADEIKTFVEALIQLKTHTFACTQCGNISDTETCSICSNERRATDVLCVVEDVRVMMAIENTMQYKGVYHILGGLISPMDGIGPTDIRIEELIKKIENENVQEVIFALSTTMEGDTTNYYLFRRLKDSGIKISSIARGIAIGDELEYTDELTLGTALSSRMPYENSLAK